MLVIVSAPLSALSPRRQQVATLVAVGYSNKQVAKRLAVTPQTVKTTLSDVYRLLRVRNRTELAHLVLTTWPVPDLPAPPLPLSPRLPTASSPAARLLDLVPCPHGCGAEVYVHPTTRHGERGRCGACREPTLWHRGALHVAEPIGLPNPGDEEVRFADYLYH